MPPQKAQSDPDFIPAGPEWVHTGISAEARPAPTGEQGVSAPPNGGQVTGTDADFIPADPNYRAPTATPASPAPPAKMTLVHALSNVAGDFQRDADNAFRPTPHSPDAGVFGNIGIGAGNMLKSIPGAITGAIAHPINTGMNVLRASPLGAAIDAGVFEDKFNPENTIYGEMYRGAKENPAQTAETLIPQVALGAGLGNEAIPKVVEGTRTILNKFRPYPSESVVSPAEITSQQIAKSILPPGGIKPEFLKAIQQGIPYVKNFAERTGNPMNTQIEALKAARGLGDEGLAHYNQNILGPVENQEVTLPEGVTELGSSAPLSKVNSRISDIHSELSAMDRAASQGAAIDTMRQSGLGRELKALQSTLYRNLEQKTGIPAEQIQGIRENYGGPFSLADSLESAKNARLDRTGRMAQGQVNINLPRPSILEFPGQLFNWARGGEQAIADRQFQGAIRNVPAMEPPRPIPHFPETAPQRPSLSTAAGITPEPNPLIPHAMDSEEVNSINSARNRSLERRSANIQDQNADNQTRQMAKTLRDQELQAPARAMQEMAKTLRKKKEQ